MALKTTETQKNVTKYVNSIEDENRKKDIQEIISIIQNITGKQPKLWGNIIGFGKYTYHRKNSKEELEWFYVGLAPRKNNITLYLTCSLDKEPLVQKLGKITYGKGCLYIKKREDIDLNILKELITKYKDQKWYTE